MRQRAMIAMAMACNPKILIADEPTTALDVTIQAQIFELMDKLKKENDTAIILITHDMGVVAELADNVAVMYMGNIVEAGTADDVLRRPTHPYTRALLDSVPVLGRGKNQDINPIKGSTPDPYDRPIGCQFAPRCNWKTESCDVMPEIQQINESDSHLIALLSIASNLGVRVDNIINAKKSLSVFFLIRLKTIIYNLFFVNNICCLYSSGKIPSICSYKFALIIIYYNFCCIWARAPLI